MNKKKFAIGTAIAAGAGYLTGILTAPKSGKDTRKNMANKATKVKIEAEKKLKIAHSELNDLIKDAENKSKDLKAQSKIELNKLTKKAEVAKQKSKEMLSAIRNGEADDKNLQAALDEAKLAKKNLVEYLKKKI